MTPHSLPFSKAWSIEDTREFIAGYAASPRNENSPAEREAYQKWQKEVFRPLMERLEKAVCSHLVFIGKEGRLGPLRHIEGTSVDWFDNWEALRTGTIEADALGYSRGMGLYKTFYMWMAGSSRGVEPDAEEVYGKMLEKMESGTFDDFEISELRECHLTGERFFVQMENWQPTIGRMLNVPGARFGIDFVPLQGGEFRDPGVEHAAIPLPSGELLIDDWFRIPEFTAATKKIKGEEDFNINAVQGRVDQTTSYAKELGFVSVSVGNSMPAVVLNDGVITIGRLRMDEYTEDSITPSGRELGSVCTDLWWATMIDREVLTQVVAAGCSREEAEKKVADLIEERGDTMKSVHLPPGEYHLYFSGSSAIFQEKFQSKEVSVEDFETPMLVLSPEPLTLPDPAPRQARRPSP